MVRRLGARFTQNAYVAAVIRLFWSLDKHDAVRAANAMAFDAFLSIIPLLAMLGFAVAKLHQHGDVMLSLILHAAPGPVGALADAELRRLSDMSLAAIAPISGLGFLWVSSSGLSTAMGVFETMFLAAARPWYVRRAIAMGCVIAGITLTASLTVVTLAITTLLGPGFGALIGLIVPTVSLVGALVVFLGIAVRRPRGMRRSFLPGAVATVALWDVTSFGYAYYVAAIARYTTFYGSLASVAILLFWLWLLAMALLVGGEINAQLEGVRDPAWMTPFPVPKNRPTTIRPHAATSSIPPPQTPSSPPSSKR